MCSHCWWKCGRCLEGYKRKREKKSGERERKKKSGERKREKKSGERKRDKEDVEEEADQSLDDGSDNDDDRIDLTKVDKELNPPIIISKGYVVGKEIGAGAFSHVFNAEKMSEKGHKNRKLAVKIVKFTDVEKEWKDQKLMDEMKISKRLNHKNVVKVHDVIKTGRRTFIFMDRADDSLESYIKKKFPDGKLPESTARTFFREAVSGIQYIHSKGVAHRDLKTVNFLVGRDGSIKLIDYGFATFTSDKKTRKATLSRTRCGSAGYMAPEVLEEKGEYDAKAADMFSMGVILYEMLTGRVPFGIPCDKSSEKRYLELTKGRKWRLPSDVNLSQEGKDLLNKLLDPNPKARPTATQVLEDPWCKDSKEEN